MGDQRPGPRAWLCASWSGRHGNEQPPHLLSFNFLILKTRVITDLRGPRVNEKTHGKGSAQQLATGEGSDQSFIQQTPCPHLPRTQEKDDKDPCLWLS